MKTSSGSSTELTGAAQRRSKIYVQDVSLLEFLAALPAATRFRGAARAGLRIPRLLLTLQLLAAGVLPAAWYE